jgi:hypothetical protein
MANYKVLKTDDIGKKATWKGKVSVDNVRTYPKGKKNA